MKATHIVHWPGQDTPACPTHVLQLNAVAQAMGFRVSSTWCFTDEECKNCENEAAKARRADEPASRTAKNK